MTPGLAREILGVSIGAEKQVLRRKWRQLALLHHPDRGGDEAKFRMVAEAYQCLIDGGIHQTVPASTNLIGGPAPRQPRRKQIEYINPWYWEEQAWLEQEFGHLGFWTRKGTRR